MKIRVRNVIIVILIVVMNVTVFASTNDLNKIVDGSTLINENCSEISLNADVKGNILNQGTAKITDNGNGSVNVYGDRKSVV